MKFKLDANYWDSISDNMRGYHLEQNISIYKRDEHIKLIKKWSGDLKGKRILKTDLFEEAFGEDSFLPWLLSQGALVTGMDISSKIARKACSRINQSNTYFKNCAGSDIRQCAFKDNVFDLIVSNSTLDNLTQDSVCLSLVELRRILKPSGILILTLDNACNPFYALGYFLAKKWRMQAYYQDRCYSLSESKLLACQAGFKVLETTAIVHIPTPFNKLALCWTARGSRLMKRFIRRLIILFSAQEYFNSKYRTGWFLALKLTKV
jgi:SAM-dependent methyltransferase